MMDPYRSELVCVLLALKVIHQIHGHKIDFMARCEALKEGIELPWEQIIHAKH